MKEIYPQETVDTDDSVIHDLEVRERNKRPTILDRGIFGFGLS